MFPSDRNDIVMLRKKFRVMTDYGDISYYDGKTRAHFRRGSCTFRISNRVIYSSINRSTTDRPVEQLPGARGDPRLRLIDDFVDDPTERSQLFQPSFALSLCEDLVRRGIFDSY